MSELDFKNKVLVDTSSFVDYLRHGKSEYIAALAISDAILLSKTVRLELLKGAKRSDRKTLIHFFEGLIQLKAFPSSELCEKVLLTLHSRGLSLGIADLIILTDTIQEKCLLLTSDKKLAHAAKILGVKLAKI